MTKTKNTWFDVDPEGLSKLVESRGKAFIVFELLQNAWDAGCKKVSVTLEPVPGCPQARLVVEDDSPEGFVDLSHAYTLFAPSSKKGDPTKRGRFNFGEKLVLAFCLSAEISTTTGTVYFVNDGTRRSSKDKREVGTKFEATLRMTREELAQVLSDVKNIVPPEGVETIINGFPKVAKAPVATIERILGTVKENADGVLSPTARITKCDVLQQFWDITIFDDPDDIGRDPESWLYEMGIPVCKLDSPYSINVHQKVPLNLERTSVTPSYLSNIRSIILEATKGLLTEKQAAESWVTDAMTSPFTPNDTIQQALVLRFGEKITSYDPSDREANNKATANGYHVLHGGALPGTVWRRIKEAGLVKPAGQLFATGAPYSNDPNAPRSKLLVGDEITVPMKRVQRLTNEIFKKVLPLIEPGHILTPEVDCIFVEAGDNFIACYTRKAPSRGRFDFNVKVLGREWFKGPIGPIVDLIVHELAHHQVSNHLSREYYDACTRLAGVAVELALDKPELFLHLDEPLAS